MPPMNPRIPTPTSRRNWLTAESTTGALVTVTVLKTTFPVADPEFAHTNRNGKCTVPEAFHVPPRAFDHDTTSVQVDAHPVEPGRQPSDR